MSRLSCCRLWQSRDPDAIIYDCRLPILPVSIRKKVLHQNNVVVLAALPSLAAPSDEVGLQCGDSLPERDAEPALMSELSSDAGTELEDELYHFQPLPETISLLSNPVWQTCRCRHLVIRRRWCRMFGCFSDI